MYFLEDNRGLAEGINTPGYCNPVRGACTRSCQLSGVGAGAGGHWC
jgi:hypothetical protein